MRLSYVRHAASPAPDAPVLPLSPPVAAAQARGTALSELQFRSLVSPAGAEAVGAVVPTMRAQVDLAKGDADDVPEVQVEALGDAPKGLSMNWEDAWRIALVVVAALGGGGVIVAGLAKLTAQYLLQAQQARHGTQQQRLGANLDHLNVARRRLLELEVDALVAVWKAASVLHPRVNGVRPAFGAQDEDLVRQNVRLLNDSYDVALRAAVEQRLHLPEQVNAAVAEVLRIARVEMIQTLREPFFTEAWVASAERNRETMAAATDHLLALARARLNALMDEAEGDKAR